MDFLAEIEKKYILIWTYEWMIFFSNLEFRIFVHYFLEQMKKKLKIAAEYSKGKFTLNSTAYINRWSFSVGKVSYSV